MRCLIARTSEEYEARGGGEGGGRGSGMSGGATNIRSLDGSAPKQYSIRSESQFEMELNMNCTISDVRHIPPTHSIRKTVGWRATESANTNKRAAHY